MKRITITIVIPDDDAGDKIFTKLDEWLRTDEVLNGIGISNSIIMDDDSTFRIERKFTNAGLLFTERQRKFIEFIYNELVPGQHYHIARTLMESYATDKESGLNVTKIPVEFEGNTDMYRIYKKK